MRADQIWDISFIASWLQQLTGATPADAIRHIVNYFYNKATYLKIS